MSADPADDRDAGPGEHGRRDAGPRDAGQGDAGPRDPDQGDGARGDARRGSGQPDAVPRDAVKAGLCAIAVMAKAPRPGQVKTRLCPPLSPEEAMAMSAAFLRDITGNLHLAATAAPLHGHVAYAPLGLEALFDGLLAPGTGLVLADGSGDMPEAVRGFGRCLLHAARALFAQGYAAVCLLNADSPTLPTALLRRAAGLLLAPGADARVVLGPAEDGGYYLLGMTAPHATLFERVSWSTERVADETRARAAELGLEVVELPAWYDVDDRAALRRLVGELAAPAGGPAGLAPYHAPATAACLDRLGLAERG